MYPYHFYGDHAHHNECIDVVEEPVVAYEIGHRGLSDDETDHASRKELSEWC